MPKYNLNISRDEITFTIDCFWFIVCVHRMIFYDFETLVHDGKQQHKCFSQVQKNYRF